MFDDFLDDHPVIGFISHFFQAFGAAFHDHGWLGSTTLALCLLTVGLAVIIIFKSDDTFLFEPAYWDAKTLCWPLLAFGLTLLAVALWWHWPHPNMPAQPTNFHF